MTPESSGSAEQRALEALLPLGLTPPSLETIVPDASTRAFFRAAGPDRSLVVMVDAPDHLEALERYVSVARFLAAQGLPVPEILATDPERGAVIMEDLGSHTLRLELERVDAKNRQALIGGALDLLGSLQQAGLELKADCAAFHQRFDRALFMREFEFFREHYLQGLLGGIGDVPGLGTAFGYLSETLAERSRTLTHRDYHVDNLLLRDGKLWMVDFQDARWGPAAYDVASLLCDRDIHRFVDREARRTLIQDFSRACTDLPDDFERELALATV